MPAETMAGFVQDRLGEGAKGSAPAGPPDQKRSHANKSFRSRLPPPKSRAEENFSLSAWFPLAEPVGRDDFRLSFAHKPSFLPRVVEPCGWQPFRLHQPVVASAHSGND